jgi:L-iditol 2-dehydrogenase
VTSDGNLAVRVLAPGEVSVEETPMPVPAGEELLVRALRASICGTDIHRVYGAVYPQMILGGPGWPGHEGIGVVESGRTAELKPGDLALLLPGAVSNGTYAERMAISPTRSSRWTRTARSRNP